MLDQFWLSQDWMKLERLNGWKLKKDGDRVILDLHARDKELYTVLLSCENYPAEAPSVVFVNSEGSRLDPRAWPRGTASFMDIVKPPQNCFLCMELTREGLQHHPDWRTQEKAWHKDRHTLMDLLNFLQRLLNGADYEGRGG